VPQCGQVHAAFLLQWEFNGMKSDNHTASDLTVDLRCAPADRWHITPAQRQQARELLALYTADLGLPRDFG